MTHCLLAAGADPSPFLLFFALVLGGPVLLSGVLGHLVLRNRPRGGTHFLIWFSSSLGMAVAYEVNTLSGSVLRPMLAGGIVGALLSAFLCFCYQGWRSSSSRGGDRNE